MRLFVAAILTLGVLACQAPNPSAAKDESRVVSKLVSEGTREHAYRVDDGVIECMSGAMTTARPSLSLGATRALPTPTVVAMARCRH